MYVIARLRKSSAYIRDWSERDAIFCQQTLESYVEKERERFSWMAYASRYIFPRAISSPKKHSREFREELHLSQSFAEKRFAREIACRTTRESSCNARLARCNVEYLIGIGCETSSPLLFRRLGRIVPRAHNICRRPLRRFAVTSLRCFATARHGYGNISRRGVKALHIFLCPYN